MTELECHSIDFCNSSIFVIKAEKIAIDCQFMKPGTVLHRYNKNILLETSENVSNIRPFSKLIHEKGKARKNLSNSKMLFFNEFNCQ